MTRTPDLRLTVLAVATCALLVGCSTEDAAPDATSPTSASVSASASASVSGTPSEAPGHPSTPTDPTTPSDTTAPSDTTSPSEPSPPTTPSPSTSPDHGDGTQPGLEMPVAPAPSVTSLTDLLAAQDDAPLVRAPLPRAASAVGRMVPDFPDLLRPSPRSSVESSSLSPSGARLQVGLVASSPLAPEEVLLAYRARLARRGLSEQAAPASAPGSLVAAFRRGRSTVTVTVSDEGSRTSYSVHASLHTGGG